MKAVGFGEDEDQAEKRMERVIVSWLKRKLAVDPKSSRQKKGLAVDLHAQWDRGTPQVFQSQRVIARWTDGHGNVSASPWNGHYKASVVGDAACACSSIPTWAPTARCARRRSTRACRSST